MKKILGLLFASMFLFAFTVSTPLGSQETTAPQKTAKQARWEGTVIRISSDNSTLDVRQVSGSIEKTVHFDNATAWNSQYHDSKTINKIASSDIKEGDRVICVGTYNENGEFHATTISKRLSHSPQ